jgi:hypothetical protein
VLTKRNSSLALLPASRVLIRIIASAKRRVITGLLIATTSVQAADRLNSSVQQVPTKKSPRAQRQTPEIQRQAEQIPQEPEVVAAPVPSAAIPSATVPPTVIEMPESLMAEAPVAEASRPIALASKTVASETR